MRIGEKTGEFIRFGIVGCIAVCVQYVSYYMLLSVLSHNFSFTFGYIISFVVNYILTTSFTFNTKKSKKNGLGFALCHVVNYCMQVGLLNLFMYLGVGKQIAPIPVFAICVPTNFLMVRYFLKKF